MKKLKVKLLVLVLALSMLAVLATGCNRGGSTLTIELFGLSGVGPPGELEGWFGQMILDEFDMVINQIAAPDGNNILLWDTRSIAGHLGDIIIVAPEDLQELIDAGLILDLTESPI